MVKTRHENGKQISEAREYLAEKMAQARVSGVVMRHGGTSNSFEEWVAELRDLEGLFSWRVIEGTIEYYLENAPPSSDPSPAHALEFYLLSLSSKLNE